MNRFKLFKALLFCLLISLVGCAEKEIEPIAVVSVTLDSTSIELIEGDSYSLEATVSPSDAENQKVIWVTSNATVASVKDGVVTAVKEGSAVITVKTDDGGKTAACNVTVMPKVIPVENISLDQTSVELVEGDEVTLIATVNPDDATNKKVTWSSSYPSVAEVVDGKVTALKSGTTTIIVRTDDGGKTATCNVAVMPKVIPVESVSLDQTSVELVEGDEVTLTATVNPDNATNKTVTWNSSDSSVAEVADGKVTTLKPGEATITVKTEDGSKTANCKITVVAKVYPVEAVSLDQTSVELVEGDEIILTATVKPDNATNKKVTWSSSNTSVAKVADGKVTTLKPGEATITVKTEDGSKTANCKITVVAKVYPVEAVSLDQTSVELVEGDEILLTATVKPDNATNKKVTWSSSNTSVAKVDDGKVTALKPGEATITVKTEDGSKTANCKITVVAKVYPVEAVSLDQTSVELVEGDEILLTATVKPDNATNKKVTWSSSNTSVAKVDDGKVTALKPGVATITVKTEDGSKTANCKITVVAKVYPVEAVSLDQTSVELVEGDEILLTATVKPDNATNKKVTWSSSNTSVAKVDDGKVTALKPGVATITVKTEDGAKVAYCAVTVLSSDAVIINVPPDNEVWYTSTTGKIIELQQYPYELISNTYENGIGKYKFKEDVVNIGAYFSNRRNSNENMLKFTSLTLPSSVKVIDAYFAMGYMHNAHTLVLPEHLEIVGTDFMGGFGENLTEKHVYFLSEKCPSFTGPIIWSQGYRIFWNQSSTLYVHYPKGADYTKVKEELEKWKTESPDFIYELVETEYNLRYE